VTRSGVWNLLFEKYDEDAWGLGSDNIIDDIEYLVRQAGFPQELKRCYERIDNAESALREIWDHQINNVGGYNVTEILQHYKNAYGLNIEPEEQ